MGGAGRSLRLAAAASAIGVAAPFALTPVLGLAGGVGAGSFVMLLLLWFVQGLVVFAAPLMLLTRLPRLRSARAHALTGAGLTLLIGLALHLYNAGRGSSVAFSLGGTILFGLGGAAAGLYLHQSRLRA